MTIMGRNIVNGVVKLLTRTEMRYMMELQSDLTVICVIIEWNVMHIYFIDRLIDI